MASEDHRSSHVEEGSQPSIELSPPVPASVETGESADSDAGKITADGGEGDHVEPAAADEARPRESLDVEGSDLEEEMNQMSTHHAGLPPQAHELSPALDGQSTPTGAGPSSPFYRKAVPPEIVTTSPSFPALTGGPGLHPPDSPTAEIIETLRAQLEAVTDQRDMLNSKLVTSFSRVADLEDDLDHLKQTQTEQMSKIDILEYERKEHLHALDTGLLVERSNVRTEMQKLAATLVEEQGKRGVAEEGRRTVENEVDDLAATLFQQANSMVATERLARSRAETRLASTEENLQVAEGVVRELQVAMQALSHGTGPASPGPQQVTQVGGPKSRPLLMDHVPYREFVLFVQHLRSLRPLSHSATQIPPPTLVSLLSHPFIARLVSEDHEPALRLDFAPGVAFYSKKSISQAIIDGMLVVEPVQAHKVFLQKPQEAVTCTLSGRTIVPQSANQVIIASSPSHQSASASSSDLTHSASANSLPPPPTHPLARATLSSGASRFFSRNSRPASPTSSQASLPSAPSPPMLSITSSHPPIYIFRIAPASTSQSSSSNPPHLYPIESGWTLERLRAACELWRFVKSGIVAPIWSYEDGTTPPAPIVTDPAASGLGLSVQGSDATGARPALPPRKSSKGWGLFGKSGSGSGSGSGWNLGLGGSGSTSPSQEKAQEKEMPKLPPRRVVAPPPIPARADEKPEVASPVATTPLTDAPAVVISAPAPADQLRTSADTAVVPEATSSTDPVPTVETPSIPPAGPDAAPPALESDAVTTPPAVVEEATAGRAPSTASSSEGFRTPKEEDTPLPTPAATEDEAEVELKTTESAVVPSASETLEPTTTTEEGVPDTKPDNETKDSSSDPTLPTATPDEASVSASSSQEVDLSSTPATARTSLDEARPITPSTPGGSAPPPLPRRAAARRPVPAPPGAAGSASISSLAEVAPVTPTTATTAVTAAPISEEAKEEKVVEAKAEETTQAGGEQVEEKQDAPALPPRKSMEAQVAPQEEKQQEEGWEEKTWRELIKVREELFWKRVGVKGEE